MKSVHAIREHRLAVGVVGLLVVLLATSTYWAMGKRSDLASAEARVSARAAASNAAQKAVPELLSYSASTLDSDVATAQDWLTDGFREEFTTLQEEMIQPAVEEQGFATTAEVTRIGVVEPAGAGGRTITFLVFVEQTTQRRGGEVAEPIATRATVRMEKVGDRWLVGELRPV